MGEPMIQDLCYPWQKPYQEALIEFDNDKLQERVAAAESAIFNRQEAISPNRDTLKERQAIVDALASLRYLRQASFGSCSREDNEVAAGNDPRRANKLGCIESGIE